MKGGDKTMCDDKCCNQHRGHDHGCGCGQCSCGPAFWTKEEKIARLEQVLQELLEETKIVEKRLAALKKEA
jgi:hypothetical protein